MAFIAILFQNQMRIVQIEARVALKAPLSDFIIGSKSAIFQLFEHLNRSVNLTDVLRCRRLLQQFIHLYSPFLVTQDSVNNNLISFDVDECHFRNFAASSV